MWVSLFTMSVQRLSRSLLYVDDFISLRASNCNASVLRGETFVKKIGGHDILKSDDVSASVSRLGAFECVTSVEYYPVRSRHIRAFSCHDPYMVYQSHMQSSHIVKAWQVSNGGSGVYLILVDDGISDHYDLRVEARFLLTDDLAGKHGTSVAGLSSALCNEAGICGVAPASKLVDVNLLSQTFLSDVTEAMAFEDVHQSWNAVYCNSWGPTDDGRCEGPGPILQDVMEEGIRNGRDAKGCIYVFAAGNGGPNENMNDDGYANHPYTIAVGALNGDDAAYFSEWGSAITTTADGFQVLTTSGSSNFVYFYGTSASAPIVAGVVALMLSANENLGWRDVQEILMVSSMYLPDEGWVTNANGHRHHYSFGSGRVHAKRAVNLAKRWTNLPPLVNASQYARIDKVLPVLAGLPFHEAFRVEHVRICMSITHGFVDIGDGSNLGAWIESPAGTRAILSKPTSRVSIIAGCSYHDWCMTSLMHWGENSTGVWTFHVDGDDQILHDVRVTLSGSELLDELVNCF